MNAELYPYHLALYRKGDLSGDGLLNLMRKDELFKLYVLHALRYPHGEPAR